MHKGHDTVTSAQARDLTYCSHDLQPNGHLRLPASVVELTMASQYPVDYADLPNLTASGQGEHLLIPGPESVKAARNFTASTQRGWKLDALVEEDVIVASELVTNAIRHRACQAGPS